MNSPLRISIVTPNRNGSAFLEKTIRSVLDQGYANLEYIVVDGASTDDSGAIIDKYRRSLAHVISEPDKGHTDAINKGFRLATGEVMGWINSDDILLPGSLAAVNKIFQQLNDVDWITGRASAMTEDDIISVAREVRPWSWLRFLGGDYRHIQQESTFWRRGLWDKAGGSLSIDHPLASDFELWTRFFRHAHLYSVDVLLGCFRIRRGQLSIAFADQYNAECEAALRGLWEAVPTRKLIEFCGVLGRPYTLQPSSSFSAVSPELSAIDPPVIALNNGKRIFYLRGGASLPSPLWGASHAASGETFTFDGSNRLVWADGPDFSSETIVALETVLTSRVPPQTDPSIRNETLPAMPLLAGPIAVYDFGDGSLLVEVKTSARTVFAQAKTAGGPVRLRVIASFRRMLVIVNGEVIARDSIDDHIPVSNGQKAMLGGGYISRQWSGDISGFVVTTTSSGHRRTYVASSPGCVRTLEAVVRSQQKNRHCGLGESLRRKWHSVRVNLAHKRTAEWVSRTQDYNWQSPARLASADTQPSDLGHLRNAHSRKRCFVMGNGPSLNKMDLGKLRDETVFACNGAFLLFDRIDWRPQFYTCVDVRVIRDRAVEITRMLDESPEMVAFFPREIMLHDGSRQVFDTHTIIPPAPNRYYFNEVPNSMDSLPASMFSLNPNRYVVQPFTVAITMLQLAAYLGFNPIYLIGCDTSYTIPKTTKQEGRKIGEHGLLLTSTADDDPNHFDPRYFGKGREWHNPQVEMMIEHHKWAKAALDPIGVDVLNATVGGQLEVYPRVDFDDLFPEKSTASTST